MVCLAALIGCAPGPDQDVARIRAALTPERIAAIDVPMIMVVAPDVGVAAALLQVGRNGDVVTWQTADGVQISLQRGVVVATRGLGYDVMSADVGSPPHQGGPYQRVWSSLDRDLGLNFHTLNCQRRSLGEHPSDDFAGPATLTRLIETCEGPHGDIRNRFDIGADGFTWGSEQWISPEVGSLQITVIKR
jgi:hypothetical protein